MGADLVHVVLEGSGHAGEHAELIACCNSGVDFVGLRVGKLRRGLEEGVNLAVLALDGVKGGLCELAGRELLGEKALVDVADTHVLVIGH